PRPIGAGGAGGTAPGATAGRPAGSGPGRSGGAASRSRAGAPGARRPWTPHAGPASGSRADSARRGRRLTRSLSDDPSPAGLARPDRVIEPHRFLIPLDHQHHPHGLLASFLSELGLGPSRPSVNPDPTSASDGVKVSQV